jgi:hypothetical protein
MLPISLGTIVVIVLVLWLFGIVDEKAGGTAAVRSFVGTNRESAFVFCLRNALRLKPDGWNKRGGN